MTPQHKENFITTKDAKEISGYTPDYLARLARSKKISGKRIGHSWLIERESLTRFLDQQGDRKIGYARSLALAREAEYRAHHSAIRQATQALTRQFSIPQQSAGSAGSVTSSLRSQALALSVALVVIVSGALVARVAVEPQLAHMAAELASETAFGFSATFGNIPSRIIARIEKTGDGMRALSERAATNTANASAEVTSSFLTDVNLSSLQMAIDDQHTSRITLVSNSPAHAPSAPIASITSEDVQAGALAAYAFVTTPSLAADTLARAYAALGAGAYTTIGASFSAYRSLIEFSGTKTLALAVTTRDALATSPRLVARVNLAFGTAIIEATHAAIYADVMMAYGTAAAAPASARATVALFGGTGDVVARATVRAPALAVALYLHATGVPAALAPRMAQAAFGAEYAVAARLITFTGSISGNYLALVEDAGRLAYAGTAGTSAIVDSSVSRIAHVPSVLENVYLRMPGKGAFALDTRSLLAAALPTLSAGERAALATYEALSGFWRSAQGAFAFLAGSPPTIVMPDIPRKTRIVAVTATPRATAPAPRILNSYPTYTTVVQGISQDVMNQSLASLRADILATTAGMLQPVAAQGATNATTIQQVNMIQDLSNLIVRNGDFRGGTFSNGSLTGGVSVSATTGSFTNLTGGATTLGSLTTSGTAALATTTVTGDLAVSGTLTPATISAGNRITAPYFVATSTTATSTFAGSLAIDTNGFVYATSTRNVGIGVLSPAALLALRNATGTQPLFVASNAAGTEVYRITNAGFVGIGTTTPGYALGVEGSSSLGNRAIAGYFTATTSTASVFPYASSTALTVSGQADTGSLIVNGASSHVGLATFGNASTTLFSAYGPSYFGGTATSSFSSAGALTLASALSISSGGTGTTTQVTNGVNYFDGTRVTSGAALTYDGTKFTAPFASSTAFTASGTGYLGSLGGAVVSSLAANYVPKWNSGTFLNSLIYDNGTNIGIGTTSPSSILSIQGNQYTSGTSFFGGAITATSTLTLTALGTPAGSLLAADATGKLIATSTVAVGNLALPKGNFLVGNDAGVAQATSSIFISSTGNVGIGTTSPGRLLSVAGAGLFGGDIMVQRISSAAANLTLDSSDNNNNSNIHFSRAGLSDTAAIVVEHNDGSATQNTMRFQTNGNNVMTLTTGGNVGIGTTTPYGKLSVEGTFLSVPAIQVDANGAGTPTVVGLDIRNRGGTNSPQVQFDLENTAANLFEIFGKTGTNALSNKFTINLSTGNVGIGTTTPQWLLNPYSATAPQLALSAGAGLSQWAMRNAGGNLYFATTTTNGTATTTTSALTILNNGNVGIGTTNPNSPLYVVASTVANTSGLQVTDITTTTIGLALNTPTTASIPYIYGNTVLAFGSSAAERMRIDTNGNVGIGTTSPSGILAIQSSANPVFITQGSSQVDYIKLLNTGSPTNNGWAFRIRDLVEGDFGIRDLTANAYRLYINSSGNVGIGTASPARKLDLSGSNVDTGGGIRMINTAAGGRTWDILNSATGCSATLNCGGLNFFDATANAGRMVIDSTGNVGIGTAAPSAQVHVLAGTNGILDMKEENTTSGTGAYTSFTQIANTVTGYMQTFSPLYTTSGSAIAGSTRFYADSSGGMTLQAANASGLIRFYTGGQTERMRIDNAGLVGIGTAAPQTALQINAGAAPELSLRDASQGVDGKNWGIISAGGNLKFRTINDAYTVEQATVLVLTRGGNVGIGMVPTVQFELSGSVGQKASGTTWSNPSDIRLKTDISPYTDGLNVITGIRPVHYTLNGLAGTPAGMSDIGVIAQEIMGVAPYTVSTYDAKLRPTDATTTQLYRFNASALTFALINAVRELDARTRFIANAASTTALTIDTAGNVGVGPSTAPGTGTLAARLTVRGNVLATSYETANIAGTTFTLGSTTLTAKMPAAVLTAAGNVDLYKLATYSLAGVQALASRVDAQEVRLTSLEDRVAKLESGAVGTATTSPFSLSTTSLASALQSFGVLISKGFAQFAKIAADNLQVGSPAHPTGITMYDKATGQPYCFQVNNGSATATPGACADIALAGAQTAVVAPVMTATTTATTTATASTSSPQAIVTATASTTDSGLPASQAGTTASTTTATSSAGSTTLATRSSPPAAIATTTAALVDTTPPVVTLNGAAALQINVGGTFTDPGATALDNVDGNLTTHIIVSGSVNASVAGLYQLTYSATDAAGNTGSVSRVVTVLAPLPAAATSTPVM